MNDLSGTLPTQIGQLQNLATFAMNRNQLTGTIPTEVGMIDSLGMLIYFHPFMFHLILFQQLLYSYHYLKLLTFSFQIHHLFFPLV